MRLIKFRGKDKKYGNWFFGNLYNRDIYGRTHICTTNNGSLNIDPKTVGQFTGLYDKNGKEIYEGDIVKWSNGMLYAVKFLDGMFYASIEECNEGIFGGFPLHNLIECEIVGNIHDNTELLKGGEK